METILSTGNCTLFDISDYLHLDVKEFFIFGGIAASFLALPTIALNALVLVAIYKTHTLHSPSNVFISGLALTDLGTGIIGLPMFVTTAVSYLEHHETLWCYLNSLSYVLPAPFAVLSYLTIGLISTDRVIALQFHLRYSLIVTNRRAVSVLSPIHLDSGVFLRKCPVLV